MYNELFSFNLRFLAHVLILLCMMLFLTLDCYAEYDPFRSNHSDVATPHYTFRIIPIRYAESEKLANFLNDKKNGLLSKHGHCSADKRTNQLWIYEQPLLIPAIQKAIRHLDLPIPQVLIRARIVSVDRHFLCVLGVMLGPDSDSKKTDSLIMDIPNITANWGMFRVPIVKLKDSRFLNLTFHALEKTGHVRVISSPSLLANNRQTSVIESGEELPYQEKGSQGSTIISFKKATLRLKVTPIVLPGKRVLLQLIINQDKISSVSINGVPAISTRHLITQVMLKNRDTIVLGGIYEQVEQQAEVGVPFLRRIPLLGTLFRHRQRTFERKQLLIFITPKIMTPIG